LHLFWGIRYGDRFFSLFIAKSRQCESHARTRILDVHVVGTLNRMYWKFILKSDGPTAQLPYNHPVDVKAPRGDTFRCQAQRVCSFLQSQKGGKFKFHSPNNIDAKPKPLTVRQSVSRKDISWHKSSLCYDKRTGTSS
jgi:hypothetical protein